MSDDFDHMGDAYDSLLFDLDDDEDEDESPVKYSRGKRRMTCKFCGMGGLHWATNRSGGWQLKNAIGFHFCDRTRPAPDQAYFHEAFMAITDKDFRR
jgi:hypothetical protein